MTKKDNPKKKKKSHEKESSDTDKEAEVKEEEKTSDEEEKKTTDEQMERFKKMQKQLRAKLPKEAQARLKEITTKLETFKKQVVNKFDKYIVGIALLPPKKPAEIKTKEGEKKKPEQKINVLVLVDDSDSKKMGKQELKSKLSAIIETMGHSVDKNLNPKTIILSELWQSCFDAKYEMLKLIAISAPLYDTGMLSAIKIAEVHKTMVLKKFEKYIVSYVLAGSLIQGRATPKSDIDVFIVIDDTDVKKMSRVELKDKLRAIIIGMGIEAGEMTGIRHKLNIQVYILTDFWLSLREANPIIFTLLRDGVPFYDRGIFMPWKQLLKMGKIKPSGEAIDMFMHTGEQMLKRVGFKLRDIGIEDIFYAILTPSQAAIMLYGIDPPAPRETPDLMREIFVEKENLIEPEYVKILEDIIQLRKDIEHGNKKEVTGKEVDDFMTKGKKYLKRVKRLFEQIEKIKEKESVVEVYDNTVTVVRDVLKFEGVDNVDDADIGKVFEDRLVNRGRIGEKYLRMLKKIIDGKRSYDEGKLTSTQVVNVRKDSREFVRFLIEYLQRRRGRELERARIRVKYGNRFGEVLLMDKVAFILHDIDSKEKEVTKANILPNGALDSIEKATLEEFEHVLATVKIPPKVFIKEPIFENLREIFGEHVEVLLNY